MKPCEPTNFHRWTTATTQEQDFTILPDGCLDIILDTNLGRAALTDWDMRPRKVTLHPGKRQTGFRLQPGISIRPQDLTEVRDEHSARQLIEDLADKQAEITQAIETLASGQSSVRRTAALMGITPRSLQRQFKRQGLPSPDFWRLLGRARRAALALESQIPLADLAALHGYSDQSHLTRACRQWFGHSPKQIQRHPTLLRDLAQPGLGTWTGEQISIK